MVNYKNGKIYKILDNTNEKFYIGSTTKEYLSQRLEKHRSHYKEYLKGIVRYVSSMEIIENGDYKIILLENYSCDCKDELTAREQYYIDKLKCDKMVNKYNAKGFNKEKERERHKKYYENNKEKLLEQMKGYRENNKEKIKINSKEYYDNNKEKLLEKKKEWRENNKEQIKIKGKEYRKNNKEKIEKIKGAKIQCEKCNAIIRKDYYKKHRTKMTCINSLPHGLINIIDDDDKNAILSIMN